MEDPIPVFEAPKASPQESKPIYEPLTGVCKFCGKECKPTENRYYIDTHSPVYWWDEYSFYNLPRTNLELELGQITPLWDFFHWKCQLEAEKTVIVDPTLKG